MVMTPAPKGAKMGKHLVLVGGGHAHMVTLSNIHELVAMGHQVTVIQPSDHHYYSGMGPGMLGGTYTPDDIRFATRHVVEKQGGTFIADKVTRVDPDARLVHMALGQRLAYDVLSFNAGSYVPVDLVADPEVDVFLVKPIERLMEAKQRFIALASKKKIAVGIVGGGPSAAEIAGNLLQLAIENGLELPLISIYSGQRLMTRFPGPVRRRLGRALKRRGVRILENDYVASIAAAHITMRSGRTHATDLVFLAQGVVPSPIIDASGLPTGPDGGLRVNRFLQSTAYPNLFGGGDCIHFEEAPLDKVGVYAVRENPILYHNLKAALEGSDLQAFDPGGDYLLIFNLGEGTGVLHKRWLTLDGRLAFMVKDYIDRRFMKRFHAIE
jgi:NADH dehydrogenase FAD-containing subunit